MILILNPKDELIVILICVGVLIVSLIFLLFGFFSMIFWEILGGFITEYFIIVILEKDLKYFKIHIY